MPNPLSGLDLLKLDVESSFRLSADGRVLGDAPPTAGPYRRSAAERGAGPGPKVIIAGCAQGMVFHVRHDLDDETAARTLALAAGEPCWSDPDALPAWLAEITELVSRDGPVEIVGPEVVFHLPNGLRFEHPAILVACDTPDGDPLLARLERDGLPRPLIDAGFLTLGDFWWPWCVAMDGEAIAAMAFATRLSPARAEIGVFTFPDFRGRGLAAAVTAGWSSLERLEGRPLIYSTRLTNRSSRQVAARLGLRPAGARIQLR